MVSYTPLFTTLTKKRNDKKPNLEKNIGFGTNALAKNV